VGCGHSGTSILTAILNSHSHLRALAGESFAFRPWFSAGKTDRYMAARIHKKYSMMSGYSKRHRPTCMKPAE
jgi:hypothetical protein